MNLLLFVFDFIILLPITLIRLFIIYLYGSYYNIKDLEILDTLTHSHKNTNIIDKIKTQTEQIYNNKYNKTNKNDISEQINKIKRNIENTLSSNSNSESELETELNYDSDPNIIDTNNNTNNNTNTYTELNDFLFTEK